MGDGGLGGLRSMTDRRRNDVDGSEGRKACSTGQSG